MLPVIVFCNKSEDCIGEVLVDDDVVVLTRGRELLHCVRSDAVALIEEQV